MAQKKLKEEAAKIIGHAMGKSHSLLPPVSNGGGGDGGGGGGGELPIKSSKRERLGRTSTFRGSCLERRVNLFREVGGIFHMKSKIKSEVFDN